MLRFPLICLLIFFGFFAGWTVGSNVVTLAGFEFRALWGAFALGLVGAFAGWRVRRRAFALLAAPDLEIGAAALDLLTLKRERLLALIVFAAMVAAAGVFFLKTSSYPPFWASVLIASAAALLLAGTPAHEGTAARGEGRAGGFAFLAFLAATLLLYFFTSVPDGDDAFYLNLPIGLKSDPGALLAHDTMLGEEDWPVLGSNYKIESLPTLTAALSAVTGIPTILVAHAMLPALWCLMLACAAYVISFAFFRRDWLWCAAIYLLLLIGLGSSYQSYGLHGLVRLYHGKAVLVGILAPLIFFVTYAALKKKSVFGAWLATGAQIAAMGATANAVYLAPLAMGLVCAARFMDVRRTDGLADRVWPVLFLTTSGYNMLIGLTLLATDAPTPMQNFDAPIESAVWSLFSNKALLAAFFGASGLAALAALIDGRWRFATLYAAAFFLFVLNPVLWRPYSDYVTGNLSFRLFWAAPFPMLLAIGVVAFAGAAPRWGRPLAALGALGLAVSPLSSLHVAKFGFAPIKVEEPAYEAARAVAEAAGPGRVLAVAPVARWLPTFENRPDLVYVRADYLEQQRSRAPIGDLDWRMSLQDWINGEQALTTAELAATLAAHCVTTIIQDREGEAAAKIGGQLRELGAAPEPIGRFTRYAFDRECAAD